MENINTKIEGKNNMINIHRILEPSDEMIIKIQTFENITPLTIKRGATVQDLKDKIFEVYIKNLIS
jgi:hypothetical protein